MASNLGIRIRLYAIRLSRKSAVTRAMPRCLVLRMVPCCLPQPKMHSVIVRRLLHVSCRSMRKGRRRWRPGAAPSIFIASRAASELMEDVSPDARELLAGFQLSPYFDARPATSDRRRAALRRARGFAPAPFIFSFDL